MLLIVFQLRHEFIVTKITLGVREEGVEEAPAAEVVRGDYQAKHTRHYSYNI